MRAVIQRVSHAHVTVDETTIGSITQGLLIFLGVGHEDSKHEAEKLWSKISKLRIFEDGEGKTNLSLADIKGEVLIVSQFTLYAKCRKGNRPSFTEAGSPEKAESLYEYFIELANHDVEHVACGKFGAMMDIALTNEGPFTLCLDTDKL